MENLTTPTSNLTETGTRLLSSFIAKDNFCKLTAPSGNVNAIADDANYQPPLNTCNNNNITSKHESPVADDDSVELDAETNSSSSCLSTVQVGRTPRAKKCKLELADLSYELQQAFRILRDLMSDAHKGVNQPFMDFVDDRDEELEDYYEVIRKPMWLKKVREKFLKRDYKNITEFVTDIRLILENCYRYYGPDNPFTKKALKLEQMLEQKLALLPRDLREKTTLESTSGQPLDDIIATRRRSTRQSLGYTSILLQQVRHEKALRDKELKKKHSEEKKAEKVEKEKEALEWEDALLQEPLKTQMKAMWELPLIGHFFYLCQTTLNMPEVSQYELERILVMPQASSLLPKIMTSLLSNPQQRSCLDRKPAMPYKVWHCRLQGRIQSWYKILQARDYRSDLVFQQLGIEANFFKILGPDNPLNEKQFHELTFHQRVWCIKGLCDYILHNHRTIQDTMNEQVIDDMREYILGYDSKGNAYLHFPQFCGQDLRIYRQQKCTKPPSPSYWGAITKKKRKIEECDDVSLHFAKRSKSVEVKLEAVDEKPLSSSVKEKCALQVCAQKNNAPKSKQKDRSPKPQQKYHSPEPHQTDHSPKPQQRSCSPDIQLQEDIGDASAKIPENVLQKPDSEIQSDNDLRSNSPPVASTRRSLRLSKAKRELQNMGKSDPCHKEIAKSDEEQETMVDDANDVNCDVANDDTDDNDTGSESEAEERLEPDIEEFELVVDTVESLRTFMEQFKEKDFVKKSKSSRRKCETKLYERLNNLLIELEPWEVKLQKAAQRIRNRLRREWESFEEKEEEIEDIWGSDKEESESRQSSDIPSGISSANEGDGTSDEESIIPFKQEQGSDRMKPKLHLAQKADVSIDELLNQDDDSCEYRTRGRLRQLKHLNTHLDASFAISKNKKSTGVLTVNGSRQDQKLNFLRFCSSQNTTSQARELFAWETLRQILVPPQASKEPGNASGLILPNQITESNALQSSLNNVLDKSPAKVVTMSEKHNLLNAKMDMLGAMQAATLMAKKVDIINCSNEKANLRLTDKRKNDTLSSLISQAGIPKLTSIKPVPSKSTGVAATAATTTIGTTVAESSENRNFLHTSVVKTKEKNDREVQKSASNLQNSTVTACALPSPSPLSRTIPTKQQLNDLTSVAENTQNLKKLLHLANSPSTSTALSEKSSKVMLLPMVGVNGKPVVYRVTASNSSTTTGNGKLMMGIKQLGKSLPSSSVPENQSAFKVMSSSSSNALLPTKTTTNSLPSNIKQTSVSQNCGLVSSALTSTSITPVKTVQTPDGLSCGVKQAVTSTVVSSVRIPCHEATSNKSTSVSVNASSLNASSLDSKHIDAHSLAAPHCCSATNSQLLTMPSSAVTQETKSTQGLLTSQTPKSISATGQQMLLIPLPSNQGRNLYLQIPAPTTVPSSISSNSNTGSAALKPVPTVKSQISNETGPKEEIPNIVASNFLNQALSEPSHVSSINRSMPTNIPTTTVKTALHLSQSKPTVSRAQRLIPALSARKRSALPHEISMSELPPLAPLVNVVRSPTAANICPLKTALPSQSQSDVVRSSLMTNPSSQANPNSALVIPSTNKLAHLVKSSVEPKQITPSMVSCSSAPQTPSRTASFIIPNSASPSTCNSSGIRSNVMSTTQNIDPTQTSLSCQKLQAPVSNCFVQTNTVTSKGPAKTPVLQTRASPSKAPVLGLNSSATRPKQAAEPTSVSSASISVASLIANNPTLAATIQKYTQSGYRVMISQQGGNVVLHAIPPTSSPIGPVKAAGSQGSVVRTALPPATPQPAQQQLLVTVPSQPAQRLMLQCQQQQQITSVPQTVSQQMASFSPTIPQQAVAVIQHVQTQQPPIVTTHRSQQVTPTTPQKLNQQLAIPVGESVLQHQTVLTSTPACFQNKTVDSLQSVVSELGLAPSIPNPAHGAVQVASQSSLCTEMRNHAVSTQNPLSNVIQNSAPASSIPSQLSQLAPSMSVNSAATVPVTDAILEQTATAPLAMVTTPSAQPQLVMIRDSNSNKQMLGLLLDNGQVIPINANVSFTATGIS